MKSVDEVINELETLMNNCGMPGVIAFHAWELLKFYQKNEHEVCANCPVDKDYVEVVRCKYCTNRGTSDCPIEELCCGWIPDDNWFCADGERRDAD